MELADYLRLLVRNWVLIATATLLGLALALGYLLTQPVLYSATSSTYITVSSVADVSSATAGSTFARDAASDLAEIASSPYVLNDVRKQLNVKTSADELSTLVSAEVVPNSAVVRVTASTTSANFSSALANAVAAELGTAIERLNPNVGNAASIGRATTISRAQAPSSPVSPSVTFALGIGLLGGFAVGVLLVLVRQSIDQRVRSAEQLVRVSRGPVLGTVPAMPAGPADRAAVLSPERIGLFRSVRSEILEGASQNRVVVVGGTRRGESTAAVTTSIAASIANARLTTLVLDAVSTSTPAAPIFESGTEPGLSEVLEGTLSIEQAVVPGMVDGLWYLPPGRPSIRRDDLIASAEMTDVLEALIARFNVVVVNADPIEDSPVARTIGRQADGIVLTCELDRSSVGEIRRAADSLERGGARLLGSVLISPPPRTARKHAPSRSAPSTATVEA